MVLDAWERSMRSDDANIKVLAPKRRPLLVSRMSHGIVEQTSGVFE